MSDLVFRFTDNKDVSEQFDGFLDYMFSASPKEASRQNGIDVTIGIFDGDKIDLSRSDDFQQRRQKMKEFRETIRKRGDRLSEFGCFDVVVDYDDGDSEALDLAVQVLCLTLSEWVFYTNTFAAFTLHLAQDAGDGTYEPVHMHVLWDRRTNERVYRDNVLQFYIHAQF